MDSLNSIGDTSGIVYADENGNLFGWCDYHAVWERDACSHCRFELPSPGFARFQEGNGGWRMNNGKLELVLFPAHGKMEVVSSESG